ASDTTAAGPDTNASEPPGIDVRTMAAITKMVDPATVAHHGQRALTGWCRMMPAIIARIDPTVMSRYSDGVIVGGATPKKAIAIAPHARNTHAGIADLLRLVFVRARESSLARPTWLPR